jgi:hypothetical protein
MAGVLIGVAAVVGAPSLHVFGLVFLLPALLVVRREIAIVAAALIAVATLATIWAGIAMVAAALLGGRRYPWLLEQPRAA